MIREIQHFEFDCRFDEIFRSVEGRAGTTKFNPDFFYASWRMLMEQGLARVWSGDACVLGALFVRNTFSGEKEALVVFWFSIKNPTGYSDAGQLLGVAEAAAKDAGCPTISSAAYETLRGPAMERKYLAHGYKRLETTFRKELA